MRILSVYSCGATFELDSPSPYYSQSGFEIFLNGSFVRKETRNVFSVFGLDRGEYEISAAGENLTFPLWAARL